MNRAIRKRRDLGITLVEKCLGADWRVYNATLAKKLGSINAAIFYQQCCYWSARTKDIRTGWFYKTVREYSDELGMSRHQQAKAIEILRKHGLIEKRIGYMGKRYFRITGKIVNFVRKQGLPENSNPSSTKTVIRAEANRQSLYKDYSKTIKDLAKKKNMNNFRKQDAIPEC